MEQIANGDEGCHHLVLLKPDEQQARIEVGKNALHHGEGVVKSAAAEENPGEGYEVESEENAQDLEQKRGLARRGAFVFGAGPEDVVHESVDAEANSVERAPKHEIPGSAVPEAAQHHGDHEVHIGSHFPFAAASKGDIEVIAQPGAERYMPAAPKIAQGGGAVG